MDDLAIIVLGGFAFLIALTAGAVYLLKKMLET